MHKNISLIILIIVASTVTGCAKFRQLTRRDYAMLKDPFLDRSAVAKVDEKPQAENAGVSGVVQVADLSASGDKKVTPASDARTASAATAAQADFKGVRMNGMGDVIAQEDGPSLEDFVGKATESVAAADKTLQNTATDMEDFTQFVKGQAEASGMTETAKELDEDMNEWFVKQSEEWNQQAEAVAEHASPLIDPLRRAQEVAMDTHPEMPSLPELGFGAPAPDANSSRPEIATPLIQHAATTKGRWVVPTATTPEIASAAAAPVTENTQAAKSAFAPDPFAAFSEQDSAVGSRSSEIQPASGTMTSNPFAAEFTAAPKPQDTVQEQWNSFNGGNRQQTTPPKDQWNSQPSPFDSPFGASFEPAPAPRTVPVPQPDDSGFNFDSGWQSSNQISR